jgi:hypothetical protein
MRTSSFLFAAASLFAVHLAAQDGVAYYKFDAADADSVVNFATGPAAAPRTGTMSWPAFFSYTQGVAGSALVNSSLAGASGKYVRTGWTGGLAGSLTIAFALENRLANTPTFYSPIAGQPGWSLATGGSAGPGLQLRGVGTTDLAGDFGVALCTLPGWNHFAIVVDGATNTATWYRNGVAASTTTFAGSVSIPAQAELLVGTDYVTPCGGLYAIDEFRFVDRAATSQEIAAWANVPAAAVAFGNAANAVLQATSTPAIGAQLALRLTSAQASAFVLLGGLSYVQHGVMALPQDLRALTPSALPGAELLVAPSATRFGTLGQGSAVVELAVPEVAALVGASLAFQALTVSGQGAVGSSNAVLAGVGR